MILKNKIIFGTTGFLVASGVIALTIVLATSGDESQSKAKSKTKIDVPKLTSNSFEMSGTQTLGVVNLKSDVILAKEVELKYFVGPDAPTNDNTYTTNKPVTLKNGDIVYVKPFIKKASISSYAFKAKANPIKFVVSGLPLTTINSSLLTKDSFVISGVQTQGMIEKKNDMTLPSEVEARYFKGASATKLDESYKLSILNDLSNGDKVHIKFFIKNEYITTHKFADDFTNLFTLPINTLPKIEINSSLLVRESFLISGSESQGTIKKKIGIALPSEVEIKYFKGNEAPEQDSTYESRVPTNLSNGDNVHIKFFIKSEYIATHKFASGFANTISIPIRGLKTLIDDRTLTTSSFEFRNAPSKTIKWKIDVILPDQLVIKYYKSLSNIRPSSDNDYKTNVPTNLSEGNHIYIKFFIKEEHKNTYKFANGFENFIHLEVKNNSFKSIINILNLKTSSFQTSGNNGTGIIQWNDKISLPNEVEIKYAKIASKPSHNNQYNPIPPINLSNGDIIYIKFFIKNGFSANHEFPTSGFDNPVKFVIKGLKTLIDHRTLQKSSFEVTGTQGKGTIGWKANSRAPILPSQVEIKYYKGAIKPSGDNSYKTIPSLALSNNDLVHIKFFIKEEHTKTHEFASDFSNYILFAINNLDKNEVDDSSLVSNSFQATGAQGTGTMELKDEITFPSEVEAKYYKGTIQPSNESDYETSFPLALSNGEKVYIKFFIKSEFVSTHKLPLGGFENPIQFVVSGLEKNGVDIANLTSSSFEVTGAQGKGTMKLKVEITLPREIEAKYYKGIAPPINESDYETSFPLALSNGEKVYIKFFIKSEFVSTHKLPLGGFENPIQFVVSGLEKNGVDIANLTSSSFEVTGAQGKGTMKLKVEITLPREIEAKYYKGIAPPINESDYETSFPLALSNGEKVYIKFFIKSEFVSTHKLPTNFANPVLFKVSNLIVNNGSNVLQDSHGNIWAMRENRPLQVLVKNRDGNYANAWISDNSQEGLLKNSNITNGDSGVIFEDSKGNIWAMGFGTPLQVLVKNRDGNYANAWISDNSQEGLLKGSKIADGYRGVIFEDSKGNIWAMGFGTPLQVLRKEGNGFVSSWISDRTQAGLLNGSNIVNGEGGVIFEDSRGNIWAMGKGTPLQVLKKEGSGFASSWINSTTREGLLKGSNITDGRSGVIFEDSRGNIWAMGDETPLQVLKKEGSRFASSWINSTTREGLLKGSNITDGFDGAIFEDSHGNLWAMGYGTSLQVLKKEGDEFSSSWINSTTREGLLKGSNITDGGSGVIFEDSSGNIWAMGYGTPLQVLKKEGDEFASSWINSTTREGLLKGSNITNGESGVIFEDSHGNIWAMGFGTPLQVLWKTTNGFVSSWISY